MRTFLHKLMVDISQSPREVITPVWSSKLWIHNAFRVYEYWFGRRAGIRPSIAGFTDTDGTFKEVAYSFEGQLALFEVSIRHFFKQFAFKIVVLPQLQLAGMPLGGITPYRFAIATDAFVGQDTSAANPTTASVTCTGSNLELILGMGDQQVLASVTAATYNSVTCPFVNSALGGTNQAAWVYHQTGPATGSNTVSITRASGGTDILLNSASYTGCAQTGQPDANNTNTSSGTTSLTVTITTIAANCWTILQVMSNATTITAGTGSTARSNVIGRSALFDSNGPLSAGSNSMTVTQLSQPIGGVIVSISPTGGITINSGFFFAVAK